MIQVVLILVALMGVGGFGAYSWITNLQAENQVLQINQEKLEGAVKSQSGVIANQRVEAIAIQSANANLREQKKKLEKDSKNLAKKLGKHELDILAQNKPGLVDRIINKAYAAELRCFELATGAEHTEKELAATKKSQSNSECPELANPNLGKEIIE